MLSYWPLKLDYFLYRDRSSLATFSHANQQPFQNISHFFFCHQLDTTDEAFCVLHLFSCKTKTCETLSMLRQMETFFWNRDTFPKYCGRKSKINFWNYSLRIDGWQFHVLERETRWSGISHLEDKRIREQGAWTSIKGDGLAQITMLQNQKGPK